MIQHFLFLFFVVPVLINAQIYKAGNTLAAYTDIIPDTLINYIAPQSPPESYFIDINGDSQNDFELNAQSGGGLGAGSRFIIIKPLTINSSVRFGRYDSIYNNFLASWWITVVAKPLQYGDSLNSLAANWYSNNMYLTDNSYNAGTFKSLPDWISTNDFYIGLKYQNAIDTIYGWIRVNCPSNNKCHLKDYSFSKCNPCVGLKKQEIIKNDIIIYPNPTSGVLNLDLKNVLSTENYSVKIVNLLGQNVMECKLEKTMSISSLKNGIYFLQVFDKEKLIATEKIIKE